MAETPSSTSQTTRKSDVAGEIKNDARDLKDTAVEQGEAKAAQEKDRVGRTAQSASSAMQTAADELRNDDQAPDWLASAFSSIAREVDGLASRLQDKSPRELASETRRFARDNPSAFLGASAIAGFAAARFLRAGAEYHDDYDVKNNQRDRRYDSSHTPEGIGSSPASPTAATGTGNRDQTVAQARANAATTRSTGGV
ncbi:hypothetical protein GRI38_12920 [Altererythrobacter aurantiacus]|uniref:DUF3618 domain-containing protein n=1 Tax=Parapontixanthobacter aurantiacus TaxID=1463599 RepID=A0A844ZIW2_9SPHN|nr:hypothetical protein [Parapontixanthobacter aurantiacus]MXO86930.1 hypothetical protein [Parapontixanthobacter aurantiacus]